MPFSLNGTRSFSNLKKIGMSLKFLIPLITCAWGFSHAQDVSVAQETPAQQEQRRPDDRKRGRRPGKGGLTDGK